MGYSPIHRRLKASVVYLKSAAYNYSVSVGDAVNYGSAINLIGSSASSYSFSSGVITLPSGYWYLVKGTPMARFEPAPSGAKLKYIWKDDGTGTALGRRGTLIMQETAQLFGGDEIAICLVDCTSGAKDIKLEITEMGNVLNINNTLYPTYASQTRAEIWRL